MTELQIENISKLISDLKDFEDSVIRQIGFSKNPNLEIEYLEDEVIIQLPEHILAHFKPPYEDGIIG